MERSQWTPEAVAQLRSAVATLRDLGIRSVLYIQDDRGARCRVDRELLVTLARERGQRPDVEPEEHGYVWEASFEFGGVRVWASFSASQLPEIGYQVTAPPPRAWVMPQPFEDWLHPAETGV